MKSLVAISALCGVVALAGIYLPLNKIGINLGFNTIFGALAIGLTTISLYLMFGQETGQA